MIGTDPHTDARIKAVVALVEDLNPLPATVTQTLKLMEDPDISINEVASVISIDQALTARILKLANSAYYGATHPATTPREAITRLGFRRMRNILFAASYSSLLGRRVASYNLGRRELWRHSVAVAMTAQRLSERVVYAAPDEAYVGGLLHDVGKLVLDQYLKMDWDRLLEVGQAHELTLIEAEAHLLGLNHAQVGGELAHKWDIPSCLVDAIAQHHAPSLASASPELAAIVHVANTICLRLGIGLAHDVFLPSPSREALRLLSLDEAEVDMLADLYGDMLGVNLVTDETLISTTLN